MPEPIWVAILVISQATSHKLATRPGPDADDVRGAVECVRGLRFTWDDDLDRGLRAIIETQINDQRCLVVLYPTGDPEGEIWHLGSAYPD
jgi:hypothetical protein